MLAGDGEEPERSSENSTGLRMLESLDPEVRKAHLVRRYYTCQGHLHGDCFYAGIYDPIEETARRLRQTTVYIVDAERLAPGGTLLLRPTGRTSCRP